MIGGQSDVEHPPVGPTAVRILAVSGSLRAASSNSQVLLAMTRLAPLNPSPNATHAQAALAETLRTMLTDLVPTAAVAIPLSGRRLDAVATLAEPTLADPLRVAMAELVSAALRSRASSRRLVGWQPGAPAS